jgi:geranylgeranyl pyrophosphate synthase
MSQLSLPPALRADLQAVETVILQRIEPRAAIFRIAHPYLVGRNGRRIHAALTLLAAQLGAYNLENVIHAAAAVELIYAASRVHSDLIDIAERRRNSVRANAHWNGDVSLMVGDYLFALAASEMALAPDSRIIAYFSRSVMSISESELAPVMTLTPLETAVEQYGAYIAGRTASLFDAACKAGVVCSGGEQDAIDTLGAFGHALGMAYQIVADVRDYRDAPSAASGSSGASLRAGVITLPLIYAFDASQNAELASLVDTQAPDEERIEWASGEVRRVGGDGRALDDARRYVQRAIDSLEHVPPGLARDALVEIARSVAQEDEESLK